MIAILLTASVYPKGMANTLLSDPDERRRQYEDALDYYLVATNVPIVFCENTLCDLSVNYRFYIDKGRLEFITFDGNNYDKGKGKGYGEAQIIIRAIEQSKILKQSHYVVKITGRVKVKNIQQLVDERKYRHDNMFRSHWGYFDAPNTVLCTMATDKFLEVMKGHCEEITDSATNEFLFERVLGRAVIQDKSIRIRPFFCNIEYQGMSGTTATPYAIKPLRFVWSDNFFYLSDICKKRGQGTLCRIYKCMYGVMMLFCKFYKG